MPQTAKVDLVGVGLNATDTVIALSHYPAPGSKVEYRTSTILPGGQVASAVIACQLWGLRTRYIGSLGDDLAATLHREAFSHAGVETHIITVPGCPSRQSLILIDADGERTVLWRQDERLDLAPACLQREWVVNARALHIDGYDVAAATLAATWAREAGIPVIADLDEIYPGIDTLLQKIDYLIVSRDFPCRLMQEPDLEIALRQMQTRYGCRLTAATLGPDGVLAWDGQHYHYAPAFQVPVIDTTGAGDTFHAAFIYGLLQSWPLDRQLEFACAAAALNCSALGARGGLQPREAIEAFIPTAPRYPAAYQIPAPIPTPA
jgi:sulfofructose kinase